MKTKLFIVNITLFATLSSIGLAREPRDYTDREPNLTAVDWLGTLRCEDQETSAQHTRDHKCDLEFVNDETNEVWNVKNNPTLNLMHQQSNKDLRIHIQAMRSPRYLFGTSYVDIKKVEALPLEMVNTDHKDLGPNSNPTHLCSLDRNWGKN